MNVDVAEDVIDYVKSQPGLEKGELFRKAEEIISVATEKGYSPHQLHYLAKNVDSGLLEMINNHSRDEVLNDIYLTIGCKQVNGAISELAKGALDPSYSKEIMNNLVGSEYTPDDVSNLI
jgi:hypothetical protein